MLFLNILGINTFEIKTPSTVAVVRGTSFEMSENKVIVQEGIVELNTKNNIITLTEGQKLSKEKNIFVRGEINKEDIENLKERQKETLKMLQLIRDNEIKEQQEKENYKKVLEGMKDMIFSPNLKKQDVEHERGVITQESWRRYKNEKFLTYTKEVIDNLYHGHNYSRVGSPLGWPETINKISQLDVKKWHTEKYVKSNMSIVLVGAVEEKDLGLIKDFIKNLPNKVVDKYEKGEVKKPKKLKIVKESEEIGDPNEQAEITIYRSMPYLPESRMAIVTLFRVLVSDLLNEKLRFEKGLCYWVRMSTWLFTDVSEIFMNIKTDEKNINLVQKEFWKIIREIKLGKYKNKFNTLKKVNIEQIKSAPQKIVTLEREIEQISFQIGGKNKVINTLPDTITKLKADKEDYENKIKEIVDTNKRNVLSSNNATSVIQ